jgi:AraC-like DNA-binding protein
MLRSALFMLDRSNPPNPPDPLSDFMELLKPRSVACGAIDSGEAHITFPEHWGVKCHCLMSGEAWLDLEGTDEPIRLKTGDIFLLPHGHRYSLATDPGLAPVDYREVLAGRLPGQVLRYKGGGRATIISVAFTVDRRNAEILLKRLPPLVHLHGDVDRLLLDQSMQQMMLELAEAKPGSRLIVEQLTTVMLAQVLRAYLAQEGQGRVGWLFALADHRIGIGIGAMHANPAYHWTVQDLAKLAGMGRTSFANRFRSSVGLTPIDYLTRLRMMLASNMLSTSNDPVSAVAEAVGYESESAFSHAFKRYSGDSPRRYLIAGSRELCRQY